MFQRKLMALLCLMTAFTAQATHWTQVPAGVKLAPLIHPNNAEGIKEELILGRIFTRDINPLWYDSRGNWRRESLDKMEANLSRYALGTSKFLDSVEKAARLVQTWYLSMDYDYANETFGQRGSLIDSPKCKWLVRDIREYVLKIHNKMLEAYDLAAEVDIEYWDCVKGFPKGITDAELKKCTIPALNKLRKVDGATKDSINILGPNSNTTYFLDRVSKDINEIKSSCADPCGSDDDCNVPGGGVSCRGDGVCR